MATPRPWQADVIRELFIYDQTVVWAISPSCTGKTWLADHLVTTQNAVKYHISAFKSQEFFDKADMIVFDLNLESDIDHPSFMKLANGSAFTTDCWPKVLCLATFEPSKDVRGVECPIITIKN